MKLKLKIFIYGNRVMHDTSCCFDSLSKFIVNGLWMWSTDKSESFEQININFVKCKLIVRIEKIGCLLQINHIIAGIRSVQLEMGSL